MGLEAAFQNPSTSRLCTFLPFLGEIFCNLTLTLLEVQSREHRAESKEKITINQEKDQKTEDRRPQWSKNCKITPRGRQNTEGKDHHEGKKKKDALAHSLPLCGAPSSHRECGEKFRQDGQDLEDFQLGGLGERGSP